MPVSPGGGLDALVVLVVEDEWFVRRIIADFLHEAGCVVIEAEDGERAIHMCNSGMQIGVLFTDINLKGPADGWEVAEAFRAACADMPVIYASGNPKDPSRCVPGSLWFDKPYQPLEILRACVRLNDASASRGRHTQSSG
jgi:CheY-like chemotaxis protein